MATPTRDWLQAQGDRAILLKAPSPSGDCQKGTYTLVSQNNDIDTARGLPVIFSAQQHSLHNGLTSLFSMPKQPKFDTSLFHVGPRSKHEIFVQQSVAVSEQATLKTAELH
jgi:hypothetical protein